MNYLGFREQWLPLGCFSIYQIRSWKNDFDAGNLSRWVKKGYLTKLRQDWYAFNELQKEPEMARFISGKIYSPSYISLHSALSIYGIIPETVDPDWGFLEKRSGISTAQELQQALNKKLTETNLSDKQKDFQHLLFSNITNSKILYFRDFIRTK